MTSNPSIRAMRSIGAVIFAVALGQIALAETASGAELWKVDLANSQLSPGLNTLTVEPVDLSTRDLKSNSQTSILILSEGKVYLANPGHDIAFLGDTGTRTVAVPPPGTIEAVHIGNFARVTRLCGYLCRMGRSDDRMTVTFTAVSPARPTVLAYARR